MCEQYHFKGITKHVTLVMDYRMPEAIIYHHKECCNHDVIQYIGYEKYDSKQSYYDSDRTDEVYDYYPTQEALYSNEVFEHILKYVNEKFVEEYQVYVVQSECYASSKIAPKADYEKLKEKFTGVGFCMVLHDNGDGLKPARGDDESVLYQYDLFRKVE